jgi:hypothetical protein
MTCLMCLFKLTTKMVQLPSHWHSGSYKISYVLAILCSPGIFFKAAIKMSPMKNTRTSNGCCIPLNPQEGSWVWGQPGLHRETLSWKEKNQTKPKQNKKPL